MQEMEDLSLIETDAFSFEFLSQIGERESWRSNASAGRDRRRRSLQQRRMIAPARRRRLPPTCSVVRERGMMPRLRMPALVAASMRDRFLLAAAILLVFAGSFLARGLVSEPPAEPSSHAEPYRRIVSMAPSVTEILFALGLGDRVVGVTRFCDYPPEARTRAKIGGLLDPNLEALVTLRPDLVIMLQAHERSEPALKELGLDTLVVSHRRLEGVVASITTIGGALGRRRKAERMVAQLDARVARIRERTTGRRRPRVLLSVYRSVRRGELEEVTVAAQDGYFDKLIEIAGGRNACPDTAAPFPQVSREGILAMQPEVIFDVVRPMSQQRPDRRAILAAWRQFLEAAGSGDVRVHLLDDDFAAVPGPRFILLAEKLARLTHPELAGQ